MANGVKGVGAGAGILSPLGSTGQGGADQPAQAQVNNVGSGINLSGSGVKESVGDAIGKLNKASDIFGVNLKFSFHEDARRLQVEISEASTGRLLKKIPPDEILDLVAKMNKMIGLLIDEKR